MENVTNKNKIALSLFLLTNHRIKQTAFEENSDFRHYKMYMDLIKVYSFYLVTTKDGPDEETHLKA